MAAGDSGKGLAVTRWFGAQAGTEGTPPIRFAFWDVRRDLVFDNVAAFAARGDAVEATCVPGDYESHVATSRPDVFYAQRAEAALWAAEGRVAPLDPLDPTVAATLAGMDDRFIAGARDEAGRLLGLTYYNGGPFALFVHADHAPQVEEPPRDLQGLVATARRLKAQGLEHPFLPRWHSTQTGLVWSVLCHLAAEGVTELTDPEAVDALGRVLAGLRDLVALDLVPPGAMNDQGDAPALGRWVGGRHALWYTMDYLAADAASAAGRPVCLAVGGLAGQPLMPGHALLCRAPDLGSERARAALRLMAWLGGPSVHRRWLQEALFPVPLAEPADRAAMATFFPAGAEPASVEALATARRTAVCSPVTQSPAALDWTAVAYRLIRCEVLTGRTAPRRAAAALVEDWRRRVS